MSSNPVAQVDAELRRFFARRMVRGLALLTGLIVLLVIFIATIKGHRSDPLAGGDFLFTNRDTRINVGKSLADGMQGTGVALLFVGFAIGASFVGAEFNVGSLTTQLLFEPRRLRVHLAKATAVAIGAALIAFGVLAVLAVSMYAGSELRGIVHGVDGTFVVDRLGEALRISAAVGASATLAYAVTLVAKRSSAGMTIFFIQFPLLSLLDPSKMPWGLISHYAPLRGLLAMVIDPTSGSDAQDRAVHTIAGGVVLTMVWVVVLVVASGLQFERAEVR